MRIIHTLEPIPGGPTMSVWADPVRPVVVSESSDGTNVMTIREAADVSAALHMCATADPLDIMAELDAATEEYRQSTAARALRTFAGQPDVSAALSDLIGIALYDASRYHPDDPTIREIEAQEV